MVLSVVISVALMLAFADGISRFLSSNPEFEILGLFVLLLIGFVLVLEGGHTAHLEANGSAFPYIPQWIVIFILLLMFAVDLYQNGTAGPRAHQPGGASSQKRAMPRPSRPRTAPSAGLPRRLALSRDTSAA